MTIATTNGHLVLTCNGCGATAQPSEEFRDGQFTQLKAWLEREGWKARRRAAEWEHACPICARHQDGRLL